MPLIASDWSPTLRFSISPTIDYATYHEAGKFLASDGAAGDAFGNAIAISDDGLTAVVGAYGDDTNRGAAYIFVRAAHTWTQQARLVPSSRAASGRFGSAVAISADGTTVLIGSKANLGLCPG